MYNRYFLNLYNNQTAFLQIAHVIRKNLGK